MTVFTWTSITHGLLSVSSTPSRIPEHPHNRIFRLAVFRICSTEIHHSSVKCVGSILQLVSTRFRNFGSVADVATTPRGLIFLEQKRLSSLQTVAKKSLPASPARRIGVGRKLLGEWQGCSSEFAALQLCSALPAWSERLDDVPCCHFPRQRS